MRARALALFAALLASTGAAADLPCPQAARFQEEVAATAIRVIDGDTVAIGAERIRLIGVDAPEVQGRCPAERAGAARASQFLRQLLATGGTVAVTRSGHDRYGRTLARLRLGTLDVSGALLLAGLARPYDGGRRAGWCGGES
jgi:micrococcal nuclease